MKITNCDRKRVEVVEVLGHGRVRQQGRREEPTRTEGQPQCTLGPSCALCDLEQELPMIAPAGRLAGNRIQPISPIGEAQAFKICLGERCCGGGGDEPIHFTSGKQPFVPDVFRHAPGL